MWYPGTPEAYIHSSSWSDFRCIKETPEQFIFSQAEKHKKFFEKELLKDDIVVTHMLPSWKCVAPKWKYSDTNCFFVNDCENLICDREPKYWFFGHTHDPIEYQIRSTQILANPKGYVWEDDMWNEKTQQIEKEVVHENENFNPKMVIEV